MSMRAHKVRRWVRVVQMFTPLNCLQQQALVYRHGKLVHVINRFFDWPEVEYAERVSLPAPED